MAETLSITDNRTGKTYEIPIIEGTVRATDLKKITTGGDDPGLATYDPAFMGRKPSLIETSGSPAC